jgi:hypothetical protein
LYLSDRNRRKRFGKELGVYSQLLLGLGAPDCPVVHRTVSGVPDWLPANWPLSGKLRRHMAIIHRTVRWCTGLSGEPTAASATVGRQIRGRRVARSNGRKGHRTVRCAPDSVWCANRGKICLPRVPPTAPRCLGAIKGTPRRMEESPKHSLIIPEHQDSILAHSIL